VVAQAGKSEGATVEARVSTASELIASFQKSVDMAGTNATLLRFLTKVANQTATAMEDRLNDDLIKQFSTRQIGAKAKSAIAMTQGGKAAKKSKKAATGGGGDAGGSAQLSFEKKNKSPIGRSIQKYVRPPSHGNGNHLQQSEKKFCEYCCKHVKGMQCTLALVKIICGTTRSVDAPSQTMDSIAGKEKIIPNEFGLESPIIGVTIAPQGTSQAHRAQRLLLPCTACTIATFATRIWKTTNRQPMKPTTTLASTAGKKCIRVIQTGDLMEFPWPTPFQLPSIGSSRSQVATDCLKLSK
jgi:hypothetical protein